MTRSLLQLGLVLVGALQMLAQRTVPAFEVATVKPSNPNVKEVVGGGIAPPAPGAPPAPAPPPAGGERGGARPAYQVDHHRYVATNFNLFGLILQAYDIKGCSGPGDAPCAFLTGGPSWIKSDKFDIEAKAPDSAPEYTMTQFVTGKAPELRLMIQTLLAARFGLKIHREMRSLPVYELTIAKTGSKLKDSAGTDNGSLLWGMTRQPNGDAAVRLTAKNRTMLEFADSLSNIAGRPVLDRTGLKGSYDFALEYPSEFDAPSATPFAGPSMFTAFQDQLGLKLEATRAPVEVLVIDRAEKPSEN